MIPAKLALWRLGSGLIALPAQVIALFLVFHGAGEAVGPLIVVAGDLVLRGGGYLLRRLVFPPLRKDQPAPVRRPGSTRPASATEGRRAAPRPR